MNTSFAFTYGPTLRCGAGISSEIALLLPDGPILFVTDANVRRIGLADALLAALTAARRTAIVFDAVEADPSQETVLAATATGRDASLTVGLPGAITAATGVDAIVHAIEAFMSAKLKNLLSDAVAKQALTLLTGNLRAVLRDGNDIAARKAMMLGSHLASIAFANAPVAGVHALAFPLRGNFHMQHGLTNTQMLPHVLRFNLEAAMPLYAELGPIVDTSAGKTRSGGASAGLGPRARRARRRQRSPQPPRRIQHRPGPSRYARRRRNAAGCLLLNNPREIRREDGRALYEAAL